MREWRARPACIRLKTVYSNSNKPRLHRRYKLFYPFIEKCIKQIIAPIEWRLQREVVSDLKSPIESLQHDCD
jgi:hypothetical protein